MRRFLLYSTAILILLGACATAPVGGPPGGVEGPTVSGGQAATTCVGGEPPAGSASFLHLSDVHLDTAGTSPGDTQPGLWRITKAKLAASLAGPDPPDFVLYTGDLPAHYRGSTPPPSHGTDIDTVLTDLHALVDGTGIPLLYLPGNNDSLAGDYYSFTDGSGRTPLSVEPASDGWPAVNAASSCGSPPCVAASNPAMGYFSASPVPGLRVISLNSVVLGTDYTEADGTMQEAAGKAQLSWLGTELDRAAKAGDKVLIAMHIPPGLNAYNVSHHKTPGQMWTHDPAGQGHSIQGHTPHWQDRFLDLVGANAATVVGILYGHTHMDELRRLHVRRQPDNPATVMELALAAPGITPLHGNNPGFKMVYYDPASKEILDFITHYTSPTAATWGDRTYSFSGCFACGGPTVLDCLKPLDTGEVEAFMNKIYTVKNGNPQYQTGSGIEVRNGQ